MTDKQKVILKALLDLSESERNEVINEVRISKTKTFSEQRSLSEGLEKAQRVMGPTSGNSCPCCGR